MSGPATAMGTLPSMSRLDRITSDPSICHGKPTVRGLRYPVENLLELLASGMTIEDVIADHPDLERDDLLAALEFGALASGMRRVVPLGAVRLSRRLASAGHDAVHTSELPEANRTTDGEVARLVDTEDRIMVTVTMMTRRFDPAPGHLRVRHRRHAVG